jgi:serine/threonine protein kinase
MVSPIGIELYKGQTAKWRIGRNLGSGACATVHSLEEIDGQSTEWAIKLAPLPTKTTKKGTSTEEVNARLIHHESVMYQNQFQDLQGTFLPRLPPYKGPQASGEAQGTVEILRTTIQVTIVSFFMYFISCASKPLSRFAGYRYLILEQMHSPLEAIVAALVKHQSGSVSFGPIALQLLGCVQAIHDRRHVVVDIKRENFMLAGGAGKGSNLETKLASRIRILDLALVQSWASIDGHRTNDKGKGMIGTPLYASLNAHAGETLSRRDDLEALGYVMSELIMQISTGNMSLQLPWSHGQSDEEIGNLKAALVNNPSSTFYKQLGSAAKNMQAYLTTVREYSFKKTPDYQHLATLLSQIKISVTKTAIPRASASAPGKTQTQSLVPPPQVSQTARRVTRSRARASTPSDSDSGSPHKKIRDDTLMETEDFTLGQPYTAAAVLHVDEDPSDDDPMDWHVVDENAAPGIESKPTTMRGLTLLVEAGPEKGTAINLLQGSSETLIVGRNPVAENGERTLALSADSRADDSHAKIELWATKKLIAVNVTDLKSSSGTFHGHEKIRRSMKIFSGGLIKLGGTTLKVIDLDTAKVGCQHSGASAARSKRNGSRLGAEPAHIATAPAHEDITMEDASSMKQASKRQGLKVQVIGGPHLGDIFEMEHGVSDTVNVGSKPTGTSSKISLTKDSLLQANHMQLKLYNYARTHFGLIITGKNNSIIKINGGTISQTGRASVNDCINIGNSVLKVIGPL